jgi:hypothetical protein
VLWKTQNRPADDAERARKHWEHTGKKRKRKAWHDISRFRSRTGALQVRDSVGSQ